MRYYAYFDKVSKTIDNLFPAKNDLVAQRYAKSVAESMYQKSPLLAKDLVLIYVCEIDLESGKVTDNTLSNVFVFKDYLDLLENKPEEKPVAISQEVPNNGSKN